MKAPRNLATRTDWSSIVQPNEVRKPYVRKSSLTDDARPPPVPDSAAGFQLVHGYKPPQNEFDFINALYLAPAEVPLEITHLIECAQFRKAESIAPILATDGQRKFVEAEAKKFDVDLVFTWERR